MSRSWQSSLALALALGVGLASRPASSSRHQIRALRIVPASARACPGEVIRAQYEAQLSDGSRTSVARADLSSLVLRGVAAGPQPRDGSWQTSAEPLLSAASGFRLSAILASDTTVRADTTVAPTYECVRSSFVAAAGEVAQPTYVRLGTFATPFHDSIVVAVIESGNDVQTITVLGPRQMRSGAIKIDAKGANGRPGRAGKSGSAGLPCSNGDDGGDGGDGSDGQDGGRVDIIVQSYAPWLAELVAVSNTGGIGGTGGVPGRGGAPGRRVAQSDGTCTTQGGRNGNAGRRGVDGRAGLPPKSTTVPMPLLWTGSPIWADSAARQVLEALMAYEAKRNR